MVRPVKTVNKSVCPDCDTEFTGKTCPECGTTKELKPLASDGIPRDMHKADVIFGDVNQLSKSSDLLDTDSDLIKERAKYQQAETNDNLREAFVLRSELKNMDLKKKMLEKQIELDRFQIDPVSGPAKDWPVAYPAGQQQPEQPGQQPQSIFGPTSPQASFMSQLMKMDKEKRGTFLEQLTEAHPDALQTLSQIFQPTSMMNPGMNNPMMNQQYPPWMYQMMPQQQQPQSQEPAKDPMVGAVEMMGIMFEMFKGMQPQPDNSANEKLTEFKNSLEKINDKLEARFVDNTNDVNETLRLELHEIRNKITDERPTTNFSQSVREMKEMIVDLESLGMINNVTSSETTVDDKLKLQQAAHTIDMDNKRFDLEKGKIDTADREADTKKDIVSALMKGRMQRRFSDSINETPTSEPVVQSSTVKPRQSKPKHVFSEIQTDSGVIQETRQVIPTE